MASFAASAPLDALCNGLQSKYAANLAIIQSLASASAASSPQTCSRFNANDVDDVFCVDLSASHLPNKEGMFATSDPYAVISRAVNRTPGAPFVRAWQSPHIDNTLSPSWPGLQIPLSQLCCGDSDLPLTLEFFDKNDNKADVSMGSVSKPFTMRDLLKGSSVTFPIAEAGKPAAGTSTVTLANAKVELRGHLSLNMCRPGGASSAAGGGGGAGTLSKTSPKVHVFVSCAGLVAPAPHRTSVTDLLSGHSAPLAAFCVLLVKDEGGAWHRVGRSPTVARSKEPAFLVPFELEAPTKGKRTDVCVRVYNDKASDGSNMDLGSFHLFSEAHFELGELLAKPAGRMQPPLQPGGIGTVKVIGEIKSNNRDLLSVEFAGIKLQNKDGAMGKSDPFLVVSRRSDDGEYDPVWQSEVIMDDLNPHWSRASIPLVRLCNGDLDRRLTITIWDLDDDGSHEFMGEVKDICVRLLMKDAGESMAVIEPAKQHRTGLAALSLTPYHNSGLLCTKHLELKEQEPEPKFKSLAAVVPQGATQELTKGVSAGTTLKFGLAWDLTPDKPKVDLDCSVLLFDCSGLLVDACFYNQLSASSGSVRHSGDKKAGDATGFDETITVSLEQLPREISVLAFVVNAHNGGDFSSVESAFGRIYEETSANKTTRTLAEVVVGAKGSKTACVLGLLFRAAASSGTWNFRCVGDMSDGRNFQESMGAIRRAVDTVVDPALFASRQLSFQKTFTMDKGDTVEIPKELFTSGDDLFIGMGWEAEGGLDLDSSVYVIDGDGALINTVYFGNRSYGNSILHAGDNRSGAGAGDDEKIGIDLDKVPPFCQELTFVVNIFSSGGTFAKVKDAYIRLCAVKNSHELARFKLDSHIKTNGLLFATLRRSPMGTWQLKALGKEARGQRAGDDSMKVDCGITAGSKYANSEQRYNP